MTEITEIQPAASEKALPVMQLVLTLRGLVQSQSHNGPPLDPMTQLCATFGYLDAPAACRAASEAAIATLKNSQKLLQSAFTAIKVPQLNAPARKYATQLPAA